MKKNRSAIWASEQERERGGVITRRDAQAPHIKPTAREYCHRIVSQGNK